MITRWYHDNQLTIPIQRLKNNKSLRFWINNKPYHVLLDSGADTSAISSKLRGSELEFKQFNVCTSDVKILETANACQLKVKGAIEVTFNINNKTLKIPFVTINDVSTQIILGQNFF